MSERFRQLCVTSAVLAVLSLSGAIGLAQNPPQAPAVAKVDVKPAALTLKVGEKGPGSARGGDA